MKQFIRRLYDDIDNKEVEVTVLYEPSIGITVQTKTEYFCCISPAKHCSEIFGDAKISAGRIFKYLFYKSTDLKQLCEIRSRIKGIYGKTPSSYYCAFS